MSKKLGIVLAVFCCIAVVLSVISLVTANCSKKTQDAQPAEKTETASPADASDAEEEEEKDLQYVMYLGTNDKDTNEPVFEPEEAKEKAEDILIEYFGGYTIQEAFGGWKDGDVNYQEYSIVIYLSDTTPEQVHEAADKLIEVFHQSSVLIQANETTTEFYSGNN